MRHRSHTVVLSRRSTGNTVSGLRRRDSGLALWCHGTTGVLPRHRASGLWCHGTTAASLLHRDNGLWCHGTTAAGPRRRDNGLWCHGTTDASLRHRDNGLWCHGTTVVGPTCNQTQAYKYEMINQDAQSRCLASLRLTIVQVVL